MNISWLKPLVISAIAAALASGCSDSGKKKPAVKPVEVSTVTVAPVDVPHWQEVMGKTEGTSQVEIRSQVSGILKRIAYAEGTPVKAGQLLFVIDPSACEAALKEARSQRDQLAAQAAQATRELKRTQGLEVAQAASRKELDDALSAEQSAKAALSAAQARVESAAVDLAHTQIRAPSPGVAGLSLVHAGALVTQHTTLLTTLTQKGDLRVVFAISDRDLGEARISRSSVVEVVNPEGARLPARLDYVSQAVDDDLGTRQLRAKLQKTTGLLSGQFVRVRLQTGVEKGVYLVPQGAVLQQSDGTYALYTMKDGKAHKTAVTVGAWDDANWIVRSGLKPGDQVIVNQILRLRDGREVKAASPAAAAGSSPAQ